jgi:hypothetical protein
LIAFDNTADSAAREVTFRVTDVAGNSYDLDDVGTFSKGVSIRHQVPVAHIRDGARATVIHVELADGSEWDAPLPPQSHRQAVEQIPALPTVDYWL